MNNLKFYSRDLDTPKFSYAGFYSIMTRDIFIDIIPYEDTIKECIDEFLFISPDLKSFDIIVGGFSGKVYSLFFHKES